MPDSYKSKDVEDLFDIGKYTSGVKLKLTWGLCVPDNCKSKDVKGMFDIGNLRCIVEAHLGSVCA